MFEENGIKQYGDMYVKSYKTSEDIYDFLNLIAHSILPYTIVKISEDQDVGLKYYNGEYSKDKFLIDFDKMKFDVDDFKFTMENGDFIRIIISTNSILLGSRNPNIDLNTIVSVLKNGNHLQK